MARRKQKAVFTVEPGQLEPIESLVVWKDQVEAIAGTLPRELLRRIDHALALDLPLP